MKGRKAMLAAGMSIAGLRYALGADLAVTVPLEEVIVTATRQGTVPPARAASEGTITQEDLMNRPLLRPAEALEAVPGLVVTQHSGDGKANQYFLRGFNLDHGTDFATFVDGVPVNMPTHAHGQGYTDLNSLVPELIERIDYRKGVYYAEQGDFSAAGAADIHYRSRLDQAFVTATVGGDGYRRLVSGVSGALGDGDVLLAGEYGFTDGPWVLPEGHQHVSLLTKYTAGNNALGYSMEATGYEAHWRATDQIPERAVSAGSISRFGNVDPSDGGCTQRWSISAETWGTAGAGMWRAHAWLLEYQLDLFSNFTYFTDPAHGDQIEQSDQRYASGASISYAMPWALLGEEGTLRTGAQIRYDRIDPVALYDTTNRSRWKTVSVTQARLLATSVYAAWEIHPAAWWRLQLGARFDRQHFDVDASLPANSGMVSASLVSPKLTLALGPWKGTELFLDFGRGFHSNDARGTTITVDPNDGVTPVSRVTPLARATGAEAGLRTDAGGALELAVAVWMLRLDSELVLDNDSSTIEPSGATRRYGVELSAGWRTQSPLRIDLDLAWTHARYSDFVPAGQYLPNAPAKVASLAVELNRTYGWFGGAHLRYLGATPLTQDGTVRSRPTLQLDAEAGYHFTPALSASVALFNVLDRQDDDVEYYYASRLRAESSAVNDLHFHPAEPRSLRASLDYRF